MSPRRRRAPVVCIGVAPAVEASTGGDRWVFDEDAAAVSSALGERRCAVGVADLDWARRLFILRCLGVMRFATADSAVWDSVDVVVVLRAPDDVDEVLLLLLLDEVDSEDDDSDDEESSSIGCDRDPLCEAFIAAACDRVITIFLPADRVKMWTEKCGLSQWNVRNCHRRLLHRRSRFDHHAVCVNKKNCKFRDSSLLELVKV